MARNKSDFQTIRSEGGLLPSDLLHRVVEAKGNLPGTKPGDYGLPQGERLNEAITQSWNRMRRHWSEFRDAVSGLPEHEPGTGITNDKWSVPLLRELGFGLLPTTPGPVIDGKTYAISRFFGTTAIHLVGCGLSLDRRAAGVRGATTNPHGLVQEFLNRSMGHLWAMVSNGLRLRVLRDNQALSRQSYLEFDLEAMFAGEVYSDFVLLWLVAHATRFAPQTENHPESCWLELWTKIAEQDGTRALGDLRVGVEKALQILGEAFVSHPRNTALRESLRSQQLSLADFHGQLLRLVYRLIFLFVAEDRTIDGESLLHPRDDSDAGRQARDRYAAYYSTARLRELAGRIKGSRHGDLWQQFNLLVGALDGYERFDNVRQNLALPALGSFLWNPDTTKALNAPSLSVDGGTELANADFLEALRHLAFTRQGDVLRPVDYKNLGAEELGGVYESLLALTPQISGDGKRFTFAEFAGNERKTSGSYYTPDALVHCLLDSALDPIVAEALKGKAGADAETAILALKVCDPAVGSGHFLVGAAHRLARHLARVRANAAGESEPSPLLYQHALRDVIGCCLYGVDISPMAAELCRVSLWLESLEPGMPLSFLDHHVQVGNSLLGATPALLRNGIPDEAFDPIDGDDKKLCKEYRQRNRDERRGQQRFELDRSANPLERTDNAAELIAALNALDDNSLEFVRRKEERYARLVGSPDYLSERFRADTWCAAFVWKKTKYSENAITENAFRRIERNPHDCPSSMRLEIQRLAQQYQFFHWHLAFPHVFCIPNGDERPSNDDASWSGGFDVVLSNPPWERIKLQDKEWFSEKRPDIANAPNAAIRRKMIAALEAEDPPLYRAYSDARRQADAESFLIRHSGRYPLCGRGDVNTYAVFAENNQQLLGQRARLGCVLPSGIATDDTTKFFFQELVARHALVAFFDFENRKGIFADVQGNVKFCLFVTATTRQDKMLVAAQLDDPALLSDPTRVYSLSADDIGIINPNTLNCPTFRTARDAALVSRIHRRYPVLIQEGPPEVNEWGIRFLRMFDMTNDAALFRSLEVLESEGYDLRGNCFERADKANRYLPLYEAKLAGQFNHRAATFHAIPKEDRFRMHAGTRTPSSEDLANPNYATIPRFWVPERDVRAAVGEEPRWLITFRNAISAVADSRSLVATIIPYAGAGNSMPVICLERTLIFVNTLVAGLNSLIVDYVLRQKACGGNLNYYVLKQLPFPAPELMSRSTPWDNQSTLADWFHPRVLELTYTAWDLQDYARSCLYEGAPFRWDEGRRFLIRCEVDAAYFQLFEVTRNDVDYIMDTFPIVKRRDEEKFGEYRTKRVILEIYDAMTNAISTGFRYQTLLTPPPADPHVTHALR